MLNAKVRLLNFGGGQRQFLALPIFLFLAPLFHNAPGFRFPPSDFCFQLSVFQLFASWPVEQRALGLLLAECGFVQAAEGMGPKSRPGRSHL
jgi:hypothetical protein